MPKLADLTRKIGSGATPRGGKNAYKGGEFSLIRSQNVLDFSFSFDGLVKINAEQANALSNVEVFEGDVLLNITGDSVARCCQVDPDCLPARVNQHVCIIRPKTNVLDAKFLKYFFLVPYQKQHLLMLSSAGATRSALTKGMIEDLEIPDFSITDQKAIAHILGTLDDKIELNQKMNQTLGDIAKAIFKSWFVDFDPVCAKAEGRPTGLDAEISDLFPDAFEDSEVGEIPAGWALKTIGDIADCVGGGTPSTKSPEFWDDGIHAWTTPKDLSNSRSIHLMQTDRKITDLGLKKISSGLLPAGTVLLSSRAPVGYLALATEPTAINQGYIALRPKGTVSNYYLLNWCDTNLSEIKSRASGTTFAEISKASFRPIRALAPHDDVMSAFHRIVSPIYERVHVSSKETQLLEDLRDTLLPKLISGELRIPDAKKFLEEAGV